MRIDPDRLLGDLEALRGIGRCGRGVVRPAFSAADVAAREWTAERMRDAGLEPVFDPAGNLFGLPPGEAPAILVGSHTDSQPEGGWLDGAYGVVAALEVARALRDEARVAVVNFQDEEGRFGALTGSNLWSGGITLEQADRLADASGLTFGEARRAMAHLDGGAFVPPSRFSAFLETHIEQGPTLVDAGEAVGVATGLVGIGRLRVAYVGEQNHAGTTPMHRRRDAFRGLAAFAARLDEALASLATPVTVWTIGQARVLPGAPSIVPGRAEFSVQWRDADAGRLARMREAVLAALRAVAGERGLGVEVEEGVPVAPRTLDPALRAALAAAAEEVAPGRWREMPSGALHDATNAARVMPSGLLFVPSIGGISHSFEEDTAPGDLVAGAEVLARAVARLAGRRPVDRETAALREPSGSRRHSQGGRPQDGAS